MGTGTGNEGMANCWWEGGEGRVEDCKCIRRRFPSLLGLLGNIVWMMRGSTLFCLSERVFRVSSSGQPRPYPPKRTVMPSSTGLGIAQKGSPDFGVWGGCNRYPEECFWKSGI